MSRLFDIEVDVRELAGLQERLGLLSGSALAEAAANTVNLVTERFDVKQQAAQRADIALDPSYIARKTKFWPATPGNPTATITTSGDLTIMSRYPLSLMADREQRDKAGRRYGRRQAGVNVTIKRSAPVEESLWFLMRLKNDNGTGVFVRTSSGRTKHMYGPSPYSLFRHQIAVGEPALLDDLLDTGAAAMAAAAEKALK
jgi:hypothetical protein